MRTIQLTKGFFATVDDQDFERIAKRSWFAYPNGKYVYAARWAVRGKSLELMHRTVLSLTSGDGTTVDHISLDGLDNRRSNLRLSSKSTNEANGPKRTTYAGKVPSSQFKGVCWHKRARKWMASVTVHGKAYYLGLHGDEASAARAYNAAATKAFGEFARLNQVEE